MRAPPVVALLLAARQRARPPLDGPVTRVALSLGVTLLTAFTAVRAHAKTFSEILGTPITKKIGEAFAQSVGRALPVTSASAGVVYTFDPATGVYEREAVVVGQLYLERAEPLGRKRLNLSLNYQRVKIDTFEGKDVEALRDTRFP